MKLNAAIRLSLIQSYSTDSVDVIKMDVPFLVRILEKAREEVGTDVELHRLVANMIDASKQVDVLTMDNYEQVAAI